MIHKFEVNGIRLVLDVNSGAVHIIDELIWDLLDYGPDFSMEAVDKGLSSKYKPEALKEGLSEMKELMDAEMLYTSGMQRTSLSWRVSRLSRPCAFMQPMTAI
jgi:uncharacterized protein